MERPAEVPSHGQGLMRAVEAIAAALGLGQAGERPVPVEPRLQSHAGEREPLLIA